MVIAISDPSLVLLIGPSGSGKSTFARRHFRSTEVLSSDFCRGLVSDDESDQTASRDAFELLDLILAKRMQRLRTTVVDATNVEAAWRRPMVELARKRSIGLVAIIFALPEKVCQARNQQRTYRQVPSDVIQKQMAGMAGSIDTLPDEGFEAIFTFRSQAETEAAKVMRQPAYS